MEIKTKTILNHKTYMDFCAYEHKWKSMAIQGAIYAGIGSLWLVLVKVLSARQEFFLQTSWFGYVLLGCGLCLWLLCGLTYVFYALNAKKNRNLQSGIEVSITFGSEEFYCHATVDGGKMVEDLKINFDNAIKAVETETYFYIYVNATTAYIVDKKGFIQGDALDLRALLSGVVPEKKYRVTRAQKKIDRRRL